ncbi:MAG: hypothetical protein GY793_00365 [Proteobacteria bacterium]|nr:hypothetical protein [Pseudomonadota bacterium]
MSINNKQNNNAKTLSVQTSLTEISSLNKRNHSNWQKKVIDFSEKVLKKVTKLPISISTTEENIMLNACAIFWYQDSDYKKFIMLKSDDKHSKEISQQFPFVACLNKESVSATLETAIKDLFGEAFKKSLPIDFFASDRISSAPTVVVADKDDKVQSILHNHVWVNQITPEQAELIQNHSDQFTIESVPEYKLTDESVHEVHKFLYHSCIRHIHNIKFSEIPNITDSMEDVFSHSYSEQGKTLH